MADNNITKVWLLNVPLERDYQHTMYFQSAAEQNSYFLSREVRSFTDFTYQKKEGVIRIPIGYDDAINANYVAYQNTAFSNKWFYAFITDYEYKGNDQTNITIETDVLQTYMFDYTVLPSFVEREHVSSDLIGEHILEEGLQIGDYVTNLHEKAGYGRSLYVVVGISKVYANLKAENGAWQWIAELTGVAEGWAQVVGGKYHGLFSGLAYRAFKYDDEEQMENLMKMIQWYDTEGHGEDIQVMFLAPDELITPMNPPEGLHEKDNFKGWIKNSDDVDVQFINKAEGDYSVIPLTKPFIDGYSPRNNKLMNYPYRYLLVANNNGIAVPFKYEDFYEYSSGNKAFHDPSFRIEGCLCPGCSIRLVPISYKGALRNDEEGINLGKFPALNWTSDLYTNWVTQNAVNIGVDIVGSIATAAIGVAGAIAAPATGGASLALTGLMAGSSVVSGVSGVARTMGEVYKASHSPAQSKGNVNSGDVIAISGQNDIHFYGMSIKATYAKILDDYFDMYGYKVNELKVPNKAHRESWWYTKTVDVNIRGNVPQIDLAKIKACYNNGVTFWRVPLGIDSGVKNYNRSNNIVQA